MTESEKIYYLNIKNLKDLKTLWFQIDYEETVEFAKFKNLTPSRIEKIIDKVLKCENPQDLIEISDKIDFYDD